MVQSNNQSNAQYAPKKHASHVRTPIQHQFEQNPALAKLFSRSDVSLSPETSSLCPNIPSMTSIPDFPPPFTEPVPESSYASDVNSGDYNMVWDNEAGFKEWVWAEKLKEEDSLLGFKAVDDPVPAGYDNTTLTTLVVRDKHKRDRDLAQIAACRRAYPDAQILLCWWHVLHAWQQHFRIVDHEKLWEILKKWIRLRTGPEFDMICGQQFRQEEDIFLASDTNMLIEAWHHVLKSMFLKGKRNCQLDFLIHVLIEDVVPYFRLRERQQIDKFEGLEADMRCRRDIKARCEKQFTIDNVQPWEDETGTEIFLVQSKSDESRFYQVDLLLYNCECDGFSRSKIQWCKHICAVEKFYPEALISEPPYLPSLSPHSSPSLSITSLSPPSLPASDSPSLVSTSTEDTSANRIALLTERLTTLVARLQALDANHIHDFDYLRTAVDDALAATAQSNVLPNRQKLLPNRKTGTEFRQTLPQVKTKRKKKHPNMDPAFSGGKASGGKAKSIQESKVSKPRRKPKGFQAGSQPSTSECSVSQPSTSFVEQQPPLFSEPATIPFIQAHYEPVPKQQFPISSAPFEQQLLFSQQFHNGYLTPQFYQPPFVQQAIPDQYSMVPQYYIV
ncbi:hypothetical protein C8J56DRAFT_1072439 [Mycena floridula]|nr:hypothetical protein C8J56DRAFT_1072439 [Mycena floridula]